ncbi:MAG: hypothetical protein AB1696_27855 [Planctomycetota bacterium]
MERKLHRMKGQLATAKSSPHRGRKPGGGGATSWKKLIEQIGRLSKGGNSVKDIEKERQR